MSGRDGAGVRYDAAWTDGYGITHYRRDVGGLADATWTSENDVNPICGCHLASRCGGCGLCVNCDGCYCYED